MDKQAEKDKTERVTELARQKNKKGDSAIK